MNTRYALDPSVNITPADLQIAVCFGHTPPKQYSYAREPVWYVRLISQCSLHSNGPTNERQHSQTQDLSWTRWRARETYTSAPKLTACQPLRQSHLDCGSTTGKLLLIFDFIVSPIIQYLVTQCLEQLLFE